MSKSLEAQTLLASRGIDSPRQATLFCHIADEGQEQWPTESLLHVNGGGTLGLLDGPLARHSMAARMERDRVDDHFSSFTPASSRVWSLQTPRRGPCGAHWLGKGPGAPVAQASGALSLGGAHSLMPRGLLAFSAV